jgi:Na+/H+-translocating membrane pyrophosphatase
LSYFIVLFAILLAFTAEPKLGELYTTIAFIIGGFTSILSGYIGMRIAVYTNALKISTTDSLLPTEVVKS